MFTPTPGQKEEEKEEEGEKIIMEETVPSILATVHGWFTPAVLFVLVNLVIGSIAVASKSSSSSSSAFSSHHPCGILSRSPASIVLDRLRSFNLRRDRSGWAPPPLEVSEILDGAPPLPAAAAAPKAAEDEPHRRSQSQHFSRSQSDAQPTVGEMRPKLAVRLKKSAFRHFEEAEVEEAVAAAATERMEDVDSVAEEGGHGRNEVDARADDFINRFRRQLKLQQLESHHELPGDALPAAGHPNINK